MATTVQKGIKPIVDAVGKFYIDKEGKVRLNFGKYKDATIKEIYDNDPSYFEMLYQFDLPQTLKQEMELAESSSENKEDDYYSIRF